MRLSTNRLCQLLISPHMCGACVLDESFPRSYRHENEYRNLKPLPTDTLLKFLQHSQGVHQQPTLPTHGFNLESAPDQAQQTATKPIALLLRPRHYLLTHSNHQY